MSLHTYIHTQLNHLTVSNQCNIYIASCDTLSHLRTHYTYCIVFIQAWHILPICPAYVLIIHPCIHTCIHIYSIPHVASNMLTGLSTSCAATSGWLYLTYNPRGTSFPIYKYIYVYTCVHESYSPILLSPHFSPSRRESKYAEAYIDLSYTHMLHRRSHIHRHTHIPTHMYAYLLNYAIFLSHVSCHKLTTLPNLYPYRYKQHI